MADYLLLMHDDAPRVLEGETASDAPAEGGATWERYFARLRALGCFEGGSAIGPGLCVRRRGVVPPVTARLSGFIRVTAASLDDARALVAGNPVFESGGTVEIRELPRSD
jgi:hypothetical protein